MTSPYEPSPLSSSFQADHGVPSPTRSIRDSLDSTPAHVEDGDTFYEYLQPSTLHGRQRQPVAPPR